MKKKKLIILVSILTMSLLCCVVFAAFVFERVINGTANTGTIEIKNKYFYDYSYGSSEMRVDSICKVNGIKYDTSITYSNPAETVFQSNKTYYVKGTYEKASITINEAITENTYYEDINGGFSFTTDNSFQSNKTYYIKTNDSGYTAVSSIVIGGEIAHDTYYVQNKSYDGISSITSIIDKNSKELNFSIDDTKKIITVTSNSTNICIITCIINSSTGITSATLDNENYYAVVSRDKTELIILDKTLASNKTTIDSISTAYCSATKQKNNSENIYLNQLGFGFTFTNTIPVYVRIHIQDAWILTKQYSSNKKETYSIKDKISGDSPFAVNSNEWYYVASENTAYLKSIVNSSSIGETGELTPSYYSFMVNPAYFYTPNQIAAYTEYMDVQVSFTIDIVQANRAKEIWGIDPSKLLNQ